MHVVQRQRRQFRELVFEYQRPRPSPINRPDKRVKQNYLATRDPNKSESRREHERDYVG